MLLLPLVKEKNKFALYHLDDDLGETTNLANQNGKLASELKALLTQHTESIATDTRPAGFVKVGTGKPLLTEPGDLPRLRDFMGLQETTAAE